MSQQFSSILTVTAPDGITRSVEGVAYVWAEDRTLYANAGRALLRIGDTQSPLPSGNLLSPWRLMALMPTLKAAFPALTESHYAAMLSQGPPPSDTLKELADISGLRGDASFRAWIATLTGEALACLLVLKALSAQNEKLWEGAQEPFGSLSVSTLSEILQSPQSAPHRLLLNLTDFLLSHDQPLQETQSPPGKVCLPSLPLSAVEMAQLYHALAVPVPRDLLRMAPEDVEAMLHHWDALACLLRRSSAESTEAALGGKTLHPQGCPPWMAAVSATALLRTDPRGIVCLGLGKNPLFSDGLGIYLHFAESGDASLMETVLCEILSQLGFSIVESLKPAVSREMDIQFQMEISASR